jgi:hypothetical protein
MAPPKKPGIVRQGPRGIGLPNDRIYAPAPPSSGPRRGGRGKPTRRALEILGNKFEGVMRADLKGAFSTFAERVDYDRVADAVYSGDYTRVLSVMPLDDYAPIMETGMAGAGKAMVQASEVEGDKFATFELPQGGRPQPDSLKMTVENPKVQNYIGIRTGELIQNVTADLQTNVQQAVATGMRDRLSPRQVAGLIRDGLPLNVRQQRSLEKYKAGLAETDLSAKKQAQLTERMRNALADERATTIARTEAQYAIQSGQRASWDEALSQGLITNASKKKWVTEASPCQYCAMLNGVTVRVNEPFVFPSNDQEIDGPPGHPRCRCSCSLIPEG